MLAVAARVSAQTEQIVTVFDDLPIHWQKDLEDGTTAGELTYYNTGLIVERVIELPAPPASQRHAQRILAELTVQPVLEPVEGGGTRPADPWTRLGAVSVIAPGSPAAPSNQQKPKTSEDNKLNSKRSQPIDPKKPPPPSFNEAELMRFITGFGGPGVFTQDLTPFAPLLHGKTTMRIFISTYKNPAWKVTLKLKYTSEGVGVRRPLWARNLFTAEEVSAEQSRVRATIEVPPGLDRPRLFITSTGHATDGTAGDEFISRTHILRIDGREVARWRPWAEDGGSLRDRNPASGRDQIGGRWRWSSDLDRSGWHPGALVEPLRIPAPELSPGKHVIEIEVLGIRPKDSNDNHGYWRVAAIAVADEPWPDALPPQ